MLFDLPAAEPPSFANLAPALGQQEAVRAARELAAGTAAPGMYLWGEPGYGKTHILTACAAAAQACGSSIAWIDADGSARGDADSAQLVLADDVESFAAEGQLALLALLKRAIAGEEVRVAAAGAVPARMLTLRDDARSRLEELPGIRIDRLADHELEAALLAHARRFGRVLEREVAQLLVHNLPRNPASLAQALLDLDEYAISRDVRIWVGTCRAWLAARSDAEA